MEPGDNNPHHADIMITLGRERKDIGLRWWDDSNVERGLVFTVWLDRGAQVVWHDAPVQRNEAAIYRGQEVKR